ncbi:hypothetical protein [Streptomyces sp. SPB162]|uniref:hypothetical protein n=1 Tax=Streptomyces sp. SPB162 TaxID=2940560 RepID=UPI0024066747|nr:hypothetical protein [Streptomyces sp. SPB162]
MTFLSSSRSYPVAPAAGFQVSTAEFWVTWLTTTSGPVVGFGVAVGVVVGVGLGVGTFVVVGEGVGVGFGVGLGLGLLPPLVSRNWLLAMFQCVVR